MNSHKVCVTVQTLSTHLSKARLPFRSGDFPASPPSIACWEKGFWVFHIWVCFNASFLVLREFRFCSCIVSKCNTQQKSSHSWGFRQKSLWCRSAFYTWLSDGRLYRFLFCRWKCLGMCAQLFLIQYLWKAGLWHAVTCWFPIGTDQFHTDLPHFRTREFWHADLCKDLFRGKYWTTSASASSGTWSHYCVNYSCSGQG